MAFSWTNQASDTNITDTTYQAIANLANDFQNQTGMNLFGTSGKRNLGNNSYHEYGEGVDTYFGSSENGSEWDNPDTRQKYGGILTQLASKYGLSPLDEGDHIHFSYKGGNNQVAQSQQTSTIGGNSSYDGIINGLIASLLQNSANQQDQSKTPYVKDSSIYDKISNVPVLNIKDASRNAMVNMLPLITDSYSGNILPGARENAMPIIDALSKSNMAVAEQDAQIQNDNAKKDMLSYVLQNTKDIQNPKELAGILQFAGVDPSAYLKYGFTSPDQVYDNQIKGLTSALSGVLGVRNADMSNALGYAQIASHEKLAQQQLAIAMAKIGASQQPQINPRDIIFAQGKFNDNMEIIEKASRDPLYQNNPQEFKNLVLSSLADSDILAGMDVTGGIKNKLIDKKAYWGKVFGVDLLGSINKSNNSNENAGQLTADDISSINNGTYNTANSNQNNGATYISPEQWGSGNTPRNNGLYDSQNGLLLDALNSGKNLMVNNYDSSKIGRWK